MLVLMQMYGFRSNPSLRGSLEVLVSLNAQLFACKRKTEKKSHRLVRDVYIIVRALGQQKIVPESVHHFRKVCVPVWIWSTLGCSHLIHFVNVRECKRRYDSNLDVNPIAARS
jgi:hypothetical protein